MAKNSLSDWDATAANNADVGGIPIVGAAAVSNFDNALRELMSQLKLGAVGKTGGTMTGILDGIGFTVNGEAVFFAGGGIAQSEITGLVTALAAKVPSARLITAGTALTGGGALDADRTINADLASEAQAIAGILNTKLMTPLSVSQAITALSPSANIVQNHVNTTASYASSADRHITQLDTTITTETDSARVMITGTIMMELGFSGGGNPIYIERGGIETGSAPASGARAVGLISTDYDNNNNKTPTVANFTYIDEVGVSGGQDYTFHCRGTNTTFFLNRSVGDDSSVTSERGTSTIILQELPPL